MSDSNKHDIAFIEALAKVLKSGDLAEVEVEHQRGEDQTLRVRLVRHSAPPPAIHAPVAHAAPAPAAAPAPPPPAPDSSSDDLADMPGAVTSPMVGTVYLQPEPGKPAFVSIGDKVTEGQTLLIIEAMKTMNQIPAPRSGTVSRILVDDGAPVEYGAPLIVLS